MHARQVLQKISVFVFVLAVGLVATTVWSPRAVAQLPTSSTNAVKNANVKNILLVHGAWGHGSGFETVIPLLQKEGFNVVSVQIPLTSFADDVATTQRALALENGPVLLVGHSYGGAVISEVGTDPKVVGLVYLAALAPEVGESTSSLLGSVTATPLFSQLSEDAYGFLKVSTAGYLQDFAEGIPTKKAEVFAATQEPTSVTSLGGIATVAAWSVNKPKGTPALRTQRTSLHALIKPQSALLKSTW